MTSMRERMVHGGMPERAKVAMAGWMVGHRRRRWPTIQPAMCSTILLSTSWWGSHFSWNPSRNLSASSGNVLILVRCPVGKKRQIIPVWACNLLTARTYPDPTDNGIPHSRPLPDHGRSRTTALYPPPPPPPHLTRSACFRPSHHSFVYHLVHVTDQIRQGRGGSASPALVPRPWLCPPPPGADL